MHEAIDILMHEHRLIEQVLGALVATAQEARAGREVSRQRVAELVEFFSGFADRCHHGKEENLLFKRMVERGFSADAGPVGVMLYEHRQGREHVGALAAIGHGDGPLSPAERESFVSHALAYASFLSQHIAKEDQMLYPMALEALSEQDLEELARAYAAFEENVMGAGEHERLHAVADRIVATAGSSGPLTAGCGPCTGCL